MGVVPTWFVTHTQCQNHVKIILTHTDRHKHLTYHVGLLKTSWEPDTGGLERQKRERLYSIEFHRKWPLGIRAASSVLNGNLNYYSAWSLLNALSHYGLSHGLSLMLSPMIERSNRFTENPSNGTFQSAVWWCLLSPIIMESTTCLYST